jgi:nicotinamidase-related amidase
MSSKLELLTPQNSQLLFIDQQPLMAFGVQSMDKQTLKNNVVGLARSAKAFGIPTTITKVVVSGLWTEVCNLTFALCCLTNTDYEIYMVADASGGTSVEAHRYGMDRMIQVGVIPVTWQQVLLEWQRDWAKRDTYNAVMAIVQEYSGAYGMGVDYAYTMVHKAPERVAHGPVVAPKPAA